MIYISKTIQHLLVDKKATKKDIADRANITASALSRAINNDNNDYHISTLCKIMQAMDCDITITISDKQTGKALYTLTDEQEHA